MSGRSCRIVWLGWMLVAFASAPPVGAQDGGPSSAGRIDRRPVVAILGASVSNGFRNFITASRDQRNETFKLERVLREAWPRDSVEIRDYSQSTLVTDPDKLGGRQVERARAAAPDLVVAIDFPIWFGYGSFRGPMRPVQRLAAQQRCLAMLATFECPLLVGDYPDMTGASARICPPWQIPTPEVLARLNQALRAWAAPRRNVRLLSLASWVTEVKSGRYAIAFDGTERRLPAPLLLQNDNLHASRLGVTLLGSRVLGEVATMLPDGHPLRRDVPTRAALIERLDLRDDLPEPEPEPAAARRAGATREPAR